MTATATKERPAASAVLHKLNASLPAIEVLDGVLALRAGTTIEIGGRSFAFSERASIPVEGSEVVGRDYVVGISDDGSLKAWAASQGEHDRSNVIGGVHYAPGGNAAARQGGDTTPAFNPLSCWDIKFRPACADPRGMTFVASVPGSEDVRPFWADIYLLAEGHELGTAGFGLTIADGSNPPAGHTKLDFATAKAVLAQHGKSLPSVTEFFALAYGGTEKTAAGQDPKKTGLDAPRTSRCGIMQAFGSLYVWGHDGDPDERRACIFGGYWDNGGWAGSRRANVGSWPDSSDGWIGARGRSDHLQHE